jgi:hypothetical membrane protein
MDRVPWWAVASALLAPVLLVGGWTVAADRQPAGYSAVGDTISALAARGAVDRWVMTAAFAGVGICNVLTAVGLRPAGAAGRLLLAIGGVATLLVALFPQPRLGTSDAHGAVAGVSSLSLALWPALAWRRDGPAPWTLRPVASAIVAALLLGLVGWFAVELLSTAGRIGLSERTASAAQALWPLVVVLTARAVDLAPDTL